MLPSWKGVMILGNCYCSVEISVFDLSNISHVIIRVMHMPVTNVKVIAIIKREDNVRPLFRTHPVFLTWKLSKYGFIVILCRQLYST